MDDTPQPSAPAEWIEALERSEAQLAAGQVVSGEAMHQRLREGIARMEDRLKRLVDAPPQK
jgi:hypothetical protein